MKIWEVHAMHSAVPVRTTAEGHADIDGLMLSEKGYLLAIRDMRPAELAAMVRDLGPVNAASELINHYQAPESDMTGRGLALGRSRLGDPLILRSDEAGVRPREFA